MFRLFSTHSQALVRPPLTRLGFLPLSVVALASGAIGGCSAQRDTPPSPGAKTSLAITHTKNSPGQDFNGDGAADLVLWRPGERAVYWHSPKQNTNSPALTNVLPASNDIFVPGDYDGDKKTDVAYFRTATKKWEIYQSSNGTVREVAWGALTDKFVPGDYNGDGKSDFAIFRPSESKWHILLNSGVSLVPVGWGEPTDRLLPADYDGDGKTDLSVYRPRDNKWYVHPSTGGPDWVVNAGTRRDRQLPADYNGDGKADFGYFSATDNLWHFLDKNGANIKPPTAFGTWTDRMVPADYDGIGGANLAVFRVDPSHKDGWGTWFIQGYNNGPDLVRQFGKGSDVLPSQFFRPRAHVASDFDGDERADMAIFRGTDAADWFLSLSGNGTAPPPVDFGELADRVFANDFDGDLRSDYALYRGQPSLLHVAPKTGATPTTRPMGAPTDTLAPGDYDGDGVAEVARVTFESGGARWRFWTSGLNGVVDQFFGTTGDVPVPGDYDGDNKTDLAIFRVASGHWAYRPSSGGTDVWIQFGQAGDIPLPADYDGDGRTDPALYRQSQGTWHARPSGGGSAWFFQATADPTWGASIAASKVQLLPADFDGDRLMDLAFFVKQASTGAQKWVIFKTGTGRFWSPNPVAGYPVTVADFGAISDVIPAAREVNNYCPTSSIGNANQSVNTCLGLNPTPRSANICETVIRAVAQDPLLSCGECSWYSPRCCAPASCLFAPECVIQEAVGVISHIETVQCSLKSLGPEDYLDRIKAASEAQLNQILTLGGADSALHFLGSSIDRLSCSGTRLPDPLKILLRNIRTWPGAPANLAEDIDLARVRIISERDSVLADSLLVLPNAAITFDNVVILRDFDHVTLKNWQSTCSQSVRGLTSQQFTALTILLHELVHVRQYRALGRTTFFNDYAVDIIRHLGHPTRGSLETEAYNVSNHPRAWFGNAFTRAVVDFQTH